jgi:hypothetical protein
MAEFLKKSLHASLIKTGFLLLVFTSIFTSIFTLVSCGQGRSTPPKAEIASPTLPGPVDAPLPGPNLPTPQLTTPNSTSPDSQSNDAEANSPNTAPAVTRPNPLEESCSSQNASLAYCNSSENLCQMQKEKSAWAKSKGQSLQTFSWDKVRSRQLVLIGDEHGISDPDSLLILIAKAKTKLSNAKACFFFEIANSKTVDELTAITEEISSHSETDRLRAYYKKILRGTKSLGFKIFLIDHPENDGSRVVNINERDQFMAGKISALFEAGDCQQAVMIIGKAHIAADVRDRKTLVQNLGNHLKLARLNPIFAKDWERPREVNAWNGLCRSAEFVPSESVIFRNDGIAHKPIYPFYSWLMKFGAFDYTILFP